MIAITKAYYFIFGVLTIAGGIMGFVNKGSMPSLIAGGLLGILLVAAGFVVAAKVPLGLGLGLLGSVLIAGKFLPDFLQKKTLMPAGLMAMLSIIGIVLTVAAWLRR